MMPMPFSVILLVSSSTLAASSTLNMEVGSSIISTLGCTESAFSIFTNCWSDTERFSILVPSGRLMPSSSICFWVSAAIAFRSIRPNPFVFSLPT